MLTKLNQNFEFFLSDCLVAGGRVAGGVRWPYITIILFVYQSVYFRIFSEFHLQQSCWSGTWWQNSIPPSICQM